MNRLVFAIPLVLVLVAGGVFAWTLTHPKTERFATGLIGSAAPAVAMPGLDETTAARGAAEAWKGPAVINFFASWCAPCQVEHPLINASAARGVKWYGVAYRDVPLNTKKYLEDLGNPYAAVWSDNDGSAAVGFGTTGVPETFVIDAEGKILHIQRGPLTPEAMEDVIIPHLKAAGAVIKDAEPASAAAK